MVYRLRFTIEPLRRFRNFWPNPYVSTHSQIACSKFLRLLVLSLLLELDALLLDGSKSALRMAKKLHSRALGNHHQDFELVPHAMMLAVLARLPAGFHCKHLASKLRLALFH